MPTTAKQLLESAHAAVPKVSGTQAQEMVANGALLVDVRDGTEVAASGKAAGAVHVPRGSLEFKA
jgi:rhodanese-related sulfurtransferase